MTRATSVSANDAEAAPIFGWIADLLVDQSGAAAWPALTAKRSAVREITDTHFGFARDHDRIAAEAALDAIDVLRTSVDADALDPAGVADATRTWPTSNATFASSNPTTWTCGPSTAASTTTPTQRRAFELIDSRIPLTIA